MLQWIIRFFEFPEFIAFPLHLWEVLMSSLVHKTMINHTVSFGSKTFRHFMILTVSPVSTTSLLPFLKDASLNSPEITDKLLKNWSA